MKIAPIIFLLGPPGVGKSTLGSRASKELGLEFLDLAGADREQLARIVADGAATPGSPASRRPDVIALPWELQRERQALALVRRSGMPLVLWAHPEDMQRRSGRDESLFTPVPRLKTRGGFGRNGTGCREFRHLERACGGVLLLVDLTLDEAVQAVRDSLTELRERNDADPVEREGLTGWAEYWRQEHGASLRVTTVIVDAMARYLSHLRAAGTSPRILTGVYSDLSAAGHLVLSYGAPKGGRILKHFDGPPWTLEFERKFTDCPSVVARYCRNLEGFARYLRERGELPKDEGE